MFDTLTRMGSSAAGDYEIERSVKFNGVGEYPYFNRTHGESNATYTVSCWIKMGAYTNYKYIFSYSNSGVAVRANTSTFLDDRIYVYNVPAGDLHNSTQEARDCSAWAHLVYKVSSNSATVYWNNVVVPGLSGVSAMSLGTTANKCTLGAYDNSNNYPWTGHIAEFYLISGQALNPDQFAETNSDTGQWSPMKFAGSYGSHDSFLDFSDNSSASALGTDRSGNGNNWTANNLSVAAGPGNDSVESTPTNNFPVFNTAQTRSWWSGILKEGNTFWDSTEANDNQSGYITHGMPSGKWYLECKIGSPANGLGGTQLGVIPDDYMNGKRCVNRNGWPGFESGAGVSFNGIDQWYVGGANQGTYGGNWAQNDIIGVAIDADSGKIALSKNGQWADGSGNYDESNITAGGQKSIGGTAPYFFGVGDTSGSAISQIYLNMGQYPFSHSIPSGYKKFCTKNMPAPAIKNGEDVFKTLIYTGNASSRNLDTGFSTDIAWIKRRSGGDSHVLANSVVGADSFLSTDLTSAANTANNCVTAFTSTGITVGSQGIVNDNGEPMVAWQWDSGSSNVTNTDGSVETTVRANTSAGISIVKSTNSSVTNGNSTFGHGLGVAPEMIWCKGRIDVTDNWKNYHKDLTANNNLMFSNAAQTTYSNYINDVTSTTFKMHAGNNANDDLLAFCFSSVEGFSKIGKYTGNGNEDGPFIYTGFRPAWVMWKSINTTEHWQIRDNQRIGMNDANYVLFASNVNADYTTAEADFQANGFKPRSNGGGTNANDEVLIYIAFAERPLKYANAR